MKNRYCRRTKLSEREFMFVVVCFCNGLTATQAHEFSLKEKTPISRQTIERKFLELGDYTFRKLLLPVVLTKGTRRAGASDAELERALVGTFWRELKGKSDYSLNRKSGSVYPSELFFMPHLKERWRRFNGFPRKHLASHLGYAVFRYHADIKEKEDKGYEDFREFLIALAEDPL